MNIVDVLLWRRVVLFFPLQSLAKWPCPSHLKQSPCFIKEVRFSAVIVSMSIAFRSLRCYDLVAFRGKPSQSFVSSFSLLLILSKFLFRTFENESEEVVDCWVQSSAKEFDYSIYSFILLVRVIRWVKKSHNKKQVIEKYESPMLCESSGMWVMIWLI